MKDVMTMDEIINILSKVDTERSVIPENCISFSEMSDYISEYANDAKDEVEFIYEILNGDDEIYSENEWVIPEINDENKNIYFNGEPAKVYIDTINYVI